MSRPDVAAQLVADIIHQRVEAARRQQAALAAAVAGRRRRGRAWYFLGALPLCIGLTAWNLARAARTPDVFTVSEHESVVRLRMYLAVQAIEHHRDSAGHVPADLAAVGFGDAGFVYHPNGGRFAITDTTASVPLTYHYGDPLEPFAGATEELRGAVAQ
jgi:hypothetical protein